MKFKTVVRLQLVYLLTKMNLDYQMNLLYKLAYLFDGEFDGETIHYNRWRAYWNWFMEYATYSFLVPQSLIFFKPELQRDVGKCVVPVT